MPPVPAPRSDSVYQFDCLGNSGSVLRPAPTRHPNHQLHALQLLRDRADAGAAVVVTLHDPNLAARFADDALLIGKEGSWQHGHVADTLSAKNLSSLYDTRFEAAELNGRRVFFQA